MDAETNSLDIARSKWSGGAAVITGAGRGLGAGLARAAASFGMSVLVADIDAASARSIADELNAGDASALAAQVDVTDPEALDELADTAFETFGDVRLLVNNAGIEHVGRVWDGPISNWHRVIDVNVHGPFHGIHAFVPRMIAAGRPATILNVASIGAFTSGAYQGAYQISKRAVLALSECLISDLETIGSPIDVCVAFPSAVDTRIFLEADPSADPDAEAARTALADYVANDGMHPDAAGRMLLLQAATGRRWLSTDPAAGAVFAGLQRDAAAAIAVSFTDG